MPQMKSWNYIWHLWFMHVYLLVLVALSVTRFGDFLTLGNFIKPLAAINLSKSPTFLGKFCKGVKIFHFSSEIIFGQLL